MDPGLLRLDEVWLASQNAIANGWCLSAIPIPVTDTILDGEVTTERIFGMGSSQLLRKCQCLFPTNRYRFQAAQVYMAMVEIWGNDVAESRVGKQLLLEMRIRLCQSGIQQSEEGSLIRITLALQRPAWMRIQNNQVFRISSTESPEQKVVLEKLQPLFGACLIPTGTYKMVISTDGVSQPLSKIGTVVELASLFCFHK